MSLEERERREEKGKRENEINEVCMTNCSTCIDITDNGANTFESGWFLSFAKYKLKIIELCRESSKRNYHLEIAM